MDPLGGGFSNSNYAVSLAGGGKYALRFFSGGAAAAERETGVMRLAASKGIRVPRILNFSLDFGGVAVMEFIPGMALSAALEEPLGTSREMFEAVGRELAGVHAIGFAEAGQLGAAGRVEKEFPDFCESALEFARVPLSGRAGERLGKARSSALSGFLKENWDYVRRTYSTPRLVHCDFNPKNVIVSKEAHSRAAILDWEFSLAGHPLIDIGNFLRFKEDYSGAAEEGFLLGYQLAGGSLPEGWRRAAKLLDLISMVQFLNSEEELERTFRTARLIIERTLSRWDKR